MLHRFPWATAILRAALILGVASTCVAPPQMTAPTAVATTEPIPTPLTQPTPTAAWVPTGTQQPTTTFTPAAAGTPVVASTPVLTPTEVSPPAEIVADRHTVTVCAEGCDFTTVQAAIDDPGTLAGHTISVTDATHTEAGIIVNKDVAILGLGAETSVVQAHERAGQARDRVFFVPQGVAVRLENLTVRHGYAREDIRSGGAIENRGTLTVSRCVIRDNQANCGGGIYNQGGALTVTDSTIRDNQADGEAPTGYECGSGGAIKVTEGGTLTLVNSTLRTEPSDDGYNIEIYGSALIEGCVIMNGSVSDHWTQGGIEVYSDDVVIRGTEFRSMRAYGIRSYRSDFHVEGSTFIDCDTGIMVDQCRPRIRSCSFQYCGNAIYCYVAHP